MKSHGVPEALSAFATITHRGGTPPRLRASMVRLPNHTMRAAGKERGVIPAGSLTIQATMESSSSQLHGHGEEVPSPQKCQDTRPVIRSRSQSCISACAPSTLSAAAPSGLLPSSLSSASSRVPVDREMEELNEYVHRSQRTRTCQVDVDARDEYTSQVAGIQRTKSESCLSNICGPSKASPAFSNLSSMPPDCWPSRLRRPIEKPRVRNRAPWA